MLLRFSPTGLAPVSRDDSRKVLHGLIVCASVIMIVGFFATGMIINKLRAWQVLPLPERFSELYFEGDSSVKSNTGHITFVVHNHEARTTHYQYRVLAQAGKIPRQTQLGQGHVSLANHKNATISQSITLPNVSARTKIIVQLNYEGIKRGQSKLQPEQQSIYLWATGTGQGT